MATKNRRVTITVPEQILKDVDWLAPLEDMTRDQLIGEAVKRFLKPHLEIREQVLKAATKPSTTYGPFASHEEFITSLHKEAEKLRTKTAKRKA